MKNKRILVVDDDLDILLAYQAILSPSKSTAKAAHAEVAKLLATENPAPAQGETADSFALQFAKQGEEGLQLVKEALAQDTPFSVAFIDIRMPPGWDGMKTAAEIRKIDPAIEIVIITAYSDRTGDEIVKAVGSPDKLLFLRKPFDPEELSQLALSLTTKWELAAANKEKTDRLVSSERRFDELTSASREWVWEIDTEGRLTYCSQGCEAIYGYTPQELLGQDAIALLSPPEEKIRQRQVFQEIISDRKKVSGLQRRAIRKDGEILHVLTTMAPVLENDKVVGIRGLTRDITENKTLEMQLELKTMELTEVNNALKVLLQQSTESMAEHERKIHENLQRLVFPYIEKLLSKTNGNETELYLNVIKSNLEKITSTFNLKISSKLSGLTPRELQVAELIKQGKSTKEMATLLGLSARTVEFYRDKLRIKLSLKKKKINLRSYLSSLS